MLSSAMAGPVGRDLYPYIHVWVLGVKSDDFLAASAARPASQESLQQPAVPYSTGRSFKKSHSQTRSFMTNSCLPLWFGTCLQPSALSTQR